MKAGFNPKQSFIYQKIDGRYLLKKLDATSLDQKTFSWLALQAPSKNTTLLIKDKVPEIIFENLFLDDTRPRRIVHEDGLFLSLRGINLNPGESPDDMVSLCLWVTAEHIITVNQVYCQAVKDIFTEISQKDSELNSTQILTRLMEYMFGHIEDEVYGLDEQLDQAEKIIDQKKLDEAQTLLVELRQSIINFRRYLMPERETLDRITAESIEWLGRKNLIKLREFSQDIVRYTDDLNAARDRATVLQDNLTNRFSERLNQKIYILSVVALIFMPTMLITSLLGINVHIPGSEHQSAFWIICGILIAIMLSLFFILKKKKWI